MRLKSICSARVRDRRISDDDQSLRHSGIRGWSELQQIRHRSYGQIVWLGDVNADVIAEYLQACLPEGSSISTARGKPLR
jgi:hypothetical protein